MAKLYPMRNTHTQRQGLLNLITDVKKYFYQRGVYSDDVVIAEIGSYAGESTEMFAQHFGRVIAIDPWVDMYDSNDPTCHAAPLSEAEKAFDERMSKYPHVEKIKDYSANVELDGVHFLYVDGNHQYEAVKADLLKHKDSVELIGGHDYLFPQHEGVVRAVKEVFGKEPTLVYMDTSWLITNK